MQKCGCSTVLDVEGAFPNVVTAQLIRNLKRRCIPMKYTDFITSMLANRRNRLKFDDYESDWFTLDNGIVQGDPLSMLLYLFYNADMLDVPSGNREDCLGYVDNIALTAEVKTFNDAHQMLQDMINREGGAKEWATQHNSKFEATKSVLIDFSRNRQLERPSMELLGAVISPQATHTSSWV